jgi:hypothetical protein
MRVSSSTTSIRTFQYYFELKTAGTSLESATYALIGGSSMAQFLLFCILFVLCWPIALFALVMYPLVWLLLLPLRIVGIAVGGALALVWALVVLPAKVMRAIV